MDIGDLASADIVLTTYDVLKEDLSHDSDRHEGDRHFLRFQKRFAPKSAIFLLCQYIFISYVGYFTYTFLDEFEIHRSFHSSGFHFVSLRGYIFFMISNFLKPLQQTKNMDTHVVY